MRSYANTPMFSIGGTYLCRDTRCGKQRHQTTLPDESRDDLFRYRVSTLTEHLPRVVVRHNCSRVQLSDLWWLHDTTAPGFNCQTSGGWNCTNTYVSTAQLDASYLYSVDVFLGPLAAGFQVARSLPQARPGPG